MEERAQSPRRKPLEALEEDLGIDHPRTGATALPHPWVHRRLPLGGRGTVIISHSDAALCARMAAELSTDGYRVHTTGDGIQLLERLSEEMLGARAQEPTLIIAEIDLPGRKGIDILADLRYAGWAVPFVLTTRKQDSKLVKDAVKLGMVAVFEEPFEMEDLRTAVPFLMERKESFPVADPV
jgi:two-component system, response regulator, stage 0 sporulation protein F